MVCVCLHQRRLMSFLATSSPSGEAKLLHVTHSTQPLFRSGSFQHSLFDYRPQTRLGEGNVFTGVCQSLCPPGGGGGEGYVHHMHHGIGRVPPMPPDIRPGHLPPPPSPWHLMAYGWQAGGTHPTAMLSCSFIQWLHIASIDTVTKCNINYPECELRRRPSKKVYVDSVHLRLVECN